MSTRTNRVAEAIRRLTSEIIQNELKDPRLAGFITITKAEVTPDLRFAKIYYSVLEEDKKRDLIRQGLKSATPYIRKCIAERLKLRYAPDISLRVDESIEHSKHIDKILQRLHEEVEDDRKDNQSN